MSIGNICWCRGCQTEQPCMVYGVPEQPDTVTITISRNEAEWWAMHRPMPEQFGNFFERQIQAACRAALKEQR